MRGLRVSHDGLEPAADARERRRRAGARLPVRAPTHGWHLHGAGCCDGRRCGTARVCRGGAARRGTSGEHNDRASSASAADVEDLARVEERIRRLSGDLRRDLDDDLWQEVLGDLARRRRELRAALPPASTGTRATTSWSDLTTTEQFEVIRDGLSAVVVQKAACRGQSVHERVSLYPYGTVEHLLPSKANGWRVTPFDYAAAEVAVSEARRAA